mgnify:CR=1 FL=1
MIEKAGAENVDNAILYDKAIQVVVDNADVYECRRTGSSRVAYQGWRF